ncbi:MAG: DUF6163 family protein [Pseudomonadota bacterium]
MIAPSLHIENLERYLVWFMRLLACMFFILGLRQWLIVLDPWHDNAFINMQTPQQVSGGFFAVLDLVAAVGLWLVSSWGAVVWLVTALSDIVIHSFFPELAMTPRFMLIFHIGSMLMYVWLTVQIVRLRAA